MSGRGKKAAAPRKKVNGYKMPAPIKLGEVIVDTIAKKKWRIGPSIGVGGFGEIYSACEHENSPKKGNTFPYVIKIEPHENGPLFVEKHFYVRNANKNDIAEFMKSKKLSSFGMPTYFGNGSHDYNGEKYRYLVLERYGKDLWNLFLENGRSFPPTTVFQIGFQMLDVLEYIHSRGYVHADIKGANILLGMKKGTENQAYLVDFGLATRVNDKEFKPDPKCAHNGTIEYTSRDAHLGVSTMRGDLEILGYNMLQWIVGELPWEKSLKQPKSVQDLKETFMNNVKDNVKKLGNVPDALVKFFEYIKTLKPKDQPDYAKCRQIFEAYLKSEGKTRSSKLEFSGKGKVVKRKTNKDDKVSNNSSVDDSEEEEEIKPRVVKKKSAKLNGEGKKTETKAKRGRPPKSAKDSESEIENETPNSIERKIVKKQVKRKSLEPAYVVNVKRTKLTPKPTPPVKKNHVNMATQTSGQKRKGPRQVSFDSPISEIIGQKSAKSSINSSGDIFDDSFTIEEKKVKPKKRLISDERITVQRIVKKKTVSQVKPRSWRDAATVVNGKQPS